jgi:hypothetical protein
VRAVLVTIELLAASVWLGGLAAIAVVARCAREQLDPAARVAFFRTLGRRYLRIGGGALVVAYGVGAALLGRGGWTDLDRAIVATAVALLAILLVAVGQARALTRVRAAALAGDPRLSGGDVARRARRAAALRGLLAAASLALVALAAIALD